MMPGPMHAPSLLILFPFRDSVSSKWVRARYVAERHELEARYAVWEIIGEPDYRRPLGAMFSPWR
jgi:hypothetical protein